MAQTHASSRYTRIASIQHTLALRSLPPSPAAVADLESEDNLLILSLTRYHSTVHVITKKGLRVKVRAVEQKCGNLGTRTQIHVQHRRNRNKNAAASPDPHVARKASPDMSSPCAGACKRFTSLAARLELEGTVPASSQCKLCVCCSLCCMRACVALQLSTPLAPV